MAKQTINIGTSPNDGTGTPLRTSFDYCNLNFTELYTATGPSGNNIVVPGTATITGDLTVRTSKLFVNATGVGIGNNGPLSVLTVSSQVGARLSVRTTDTIFGTVVGGSGFDSLNDAGSGLVPFGCRGSTITLGSSAGIGFQIDASGNVTFQNVGGVAGTAMTLNSTGLGIGTASATTKLDVQGSGDGELRLRAGSDAALIFSETTANKNWKIKPSSGTLCFQYSATAFNSGYANLLQVTETGNVGIGVTPSAWATYKAVSVGGIGASVFGLGSSQAGVAQGAFFNNGAGSGWAYSATSQVPAYYLQINGEHVFNNAISGTAGNQITAWNQVMKIDTNGNLILKSSNTPATLANNGELTVNATSNTNLRFSYRGSDGTTRVANLTLA